MVRSVARRLKQRLASIPSRLRRFSTPRALRRHDKLHLGAGTRQIPGWANLDIAGKGNLLWDLRKPLPLEPGKVRLVYSEHFVEHITRPDALLLLRNVRQVIADDGVVRISTPDLRAITGWYQEGRLVEMEHGGWFPETPCQMVNEALREWGHIFVYDESEMRSLLSEAGFSRVERVRHGESEHAGLRGLETRPDFGDLIVEAQV